MTTTMSDVIAAQADEIISLRAEIRQLQAERDRAQARCLELAGRAIALQAELRPYRRAIIRVAKLCDAADGVFPAYAVERIRQAARLEERP